MKGKEELPRRTEKTTKELYFASYDFSEFLRGRRGGLFEVSSEKLC
jgi:hypothetical protein